MKKFILVLATIFVASGILSASVINVSSPTAGSNWCIGSPINITWNETPKNHDFVKIRLFDQNGVNRIWKIDDKTLNNGSYSWTILNNILPGTYTIRVKTLDDSVSGNSAIFTISDCSAPTGSINVTKPVNGDVSNQGGHCLINWTSSGAVGSSVKIDLINQTSISVITNIISSTNNTGTFDWNVPNSIPEGNYRIRVQNLGGTITGISAVFGINIQWASKTDLRVTGYMFKHPDLEIKVLLFPEELETFKEGLVEFKVTNVGNGESSPTKLIAYAGGNKIATWNVPKLKPNRFFYKTKTITPDGPGYTVWSANVDPENSIGDTHRSNNHASKKMTIKGPDLTIVKISSTKYKKRMHETCSMDVTVKNVGHAPVKRFEIDCDWTACPLIALGRAYGVFNGVLKPGQSTTFHFKHKYACLGTKNVKLYVDVNNQVKEENENNNTCGFTFHIQIAPDKYMVEKVVNCN